MPSKNIRDTPTQLLCSTTFSKSQDEDYTYQFSRSSSARNLKKTNTTYDLGKAIQQKKCLVGNCRHVEFVNRVEYSLPH